MGPDSRLKSQPRGSNPSLKAQIPASRLKSQPRGSNQTTCNGQTEGRTDGRTNESPPVFYKTLSPSGPVPCYPSPTITNIRSRATGIADHILPLGDWFVFCILSRHQEGRELPEMNDPKLKALS